MNAPAEVNPGVGQVTDRDMSDCTEESDKSFWHCSDIKNVRNIEILRGDSDNNSTRQDGILIDKPFYQNSLGQPEGQDIHTDRCITTLDGELAGSLPITTE